MKNLLQTCDGLITIMKEGRTVLKANADSNAIASSSSVICLLFIDPVFYLASS